jgi:ATP phosphoribosyltransferase
MLTLAIQKSGRLSDKTMKLLKDAGITFQNGKSATLKSKATNFPLELLFFRDDDIPEYVADKVADAGIVGENVCLEKGRDVEVVEKLGFARCRMSIALPKHKKYESSQDLNGLKIATSYPGILRKYLEENDITADIHTISGSVEITPGINLADAIFDIVSTGSTLISNGLKEVEKVIDSEAVLISNTDLDKDKRDILDKLLFRIKSVKVAADNKYILLNAPNDAINKITELLPGMKSPTIMPLAQEGWSSVHTVINEDQFWEKIESLKAVGAQGILVFPIENMIL